MQQQRGLNGIIGEMRHNNRDLLFHLDGLTSPNEVWEKIKTLFGKTCEIRGHQLENVLISLSPSNVESLQVYFSKFKVLILQLKHYGIEKKDEQLVWISFRSLAMTI